ncbi:hypothetical protein CF66_1036 [Candidatus Photodesmus katoptron]|nr:accessory factor UbiK family protein [Candidatus Photodesmus katoptron]KEY90762.1 hypothetical protein CF66_1036 [Candidatus Photodesmus katoptron]
MFNQIKIEKIVKQIHDVMPTSLKELTTDLDQKIYQIIQSKLNKLSVVSREEFDIQSQALFCARKKLTEMEKKLLELESKLSKKTN